MKKRYNKGLENVLVFEAKQKITDFGYESEEVYRFNIDVTRFYRDGSISYFVFDYIRTILFPDLYLEI